MENHAENLGNIMRKKVTIMQKRHQIMQKFQTYKIHINVLPRI